MSSSPSPGAKGTGQYTVVARRYRPQSFEDLIGQSHVVTALGNAIRQKRVGHAYLFTGARGVGKTSAARIFAKCLNCQGGAGPTPCNQCDICQLVSTGEDIDVIEIDGASNRGIDEIRELRSNAGVRPSRARYKIYIIDEVHMLTKEAFNALLKTLEEPPGHVKFIFCTTDPQKIPITVLSRCQRFDFVPVDSADIAGRLREIAAAEGVAAEPAALELLARRAGGSMRDSQSLLEQLLSFSESALTVADVNRLLGTADLSTIASIVRGMASADPGQAIRSVHSAILSGADPSRFAQQLVTYVRDLMALGAGCELPLMLQILEPDLVEARELSASLGMERLQTLLQILDTAVVRMQHSLHARILLEAAVVRGASLDNVLPIASLIAAAASQPMPARPAEKSAPSITPAENLPVAGPPAAGQPSAATPNPQGTSDLRAKKKEVPEQRSGGAGAADRLEASLTRNPPVGGNSLSPAAAVVEAVAAPCESREPDGVSVGEIWDRMLKNLHASGDMIAEMVTNYSRVEAGEKNLVTVTLKREYDCQLCNDTERKKRLETALSSAAGQPMRLDFRLDAAAQATPEPMAPRMSRLQKMRTLEQHPLVRSVIDTFEAEITDFTERRPARNP